MKIIHSKIDFILELILDHSLTFLIISNKMQMSGVGASNIGYSQLMKII